MRDRPDGGVAAMLDLVVAFPEHLAQSAGLPGLDSVPGLPESCRRIVFCGMGGSAIAGDLVQPLLADRDRQLVVWRDYGLPHWAGPQDLVIAASYSGDTEESLSALAAARERGCPLVGISSGGRLAAEAERGGGFPRIVLPGGLPPRAALGHGLGALLHVLAAGGVIADPDAGIGEACAQLRRAVPALLAPWRADGGRADEPGPDPDIPSVRGLAEALQGRIPVLYSSGREAHGAALRWRAQLNENAKVPAYLAAFPELDHNDLVGWNLTRELRRRFVLVILEGGDPEPRERIRVDATLELLRNEFDTVHRIPARGDTPLQRVLSLVQFGDFLSCHLAALAGIDPMPVDRIERLKTILSRSRTGISSGAEPDEKERR